MTKKLFVIVLAMVAIFATGWWYADYSTTQMINNMKEELIEEEKEKNHELRLHMSQEQLWYTYLVDRAMFDDDASYENGMLLIDDLNIMMNRTHDGYFEVHKLDVRVSHTFLNTLAWNTHDIVTYGHAFR